MAATDPTASLLLVEDDEECREMLKLIIQVRFRDIVVHAACNGRQGLERFREYAPGIVITDLNMPEMGGLQMAEQILRIEPATKFIIVTADTEKLEEARGERPGAVRYVLKPIDYQDLFDSIEVCLREAAPRG